MDKIIGMPDSEVTQDLSSLSEKEKEIYKLVLQDWPTTALEIAEHYQEVPDSREGKRRLSTKYSYYIKKLVQKRFVLSKKAGNTTLVWPLSVEKYRAIHDIISD